MADLALFCSYCPADTTADHECTHDPDGPYMERFDMDSCTFRCSACGTEISDQPCPTHAPREAPGLRLIPCDAESPHWTWAHDRDDYGVPCPWCMLDAHAERDRLARQCRHWPWRRWRVTGWVVGWAYQLGIISGGGGWTSGDGHDGCQTLPGWRGLRGQRPYILGASRNTWRCWLHGHRRGEEVGFGWCGKCMPWPCCGSATAAHLAGCREDAL